MRLAFKSFYSTNSISSYFSKQPLNYETYLQRLKKFPTIYNTCDSKDKQSLLIDYINANRTLQLHNTYYTRSNNKNKDFLGIQFSPNNQELESQLYKTLFNKYKHDSIPNALIIKQYISTPPQPKDVQQTIEIIQENLKYNLRHNRDDDTSVFYTALNSILDQNDYLNGFRLIDVTLNSPEYQELKKIRMLRGITGFVIGNIVLTGVESTLLPFVPELVWLSVNLISTSLVVYGLYGIQLIQVVGRVSWRKYISQLYKYLHQQELIAVNKIITHLEEHNEVNVRNYHHSKVRDLLNLKMFTTNDYILEMPNESNELIALNNQDSNNQPDEDVKQLQLFFKQELNKRKMALCDLSDELLFLEYWRTHGENFKWVEPDQDPGEIVKLNIKNK